MPAINPYRQRRRNNFLPANVLDYQDQQAPVAPEPPIIPERDDSMFGVNMPKDRLNTLGETPITGLQGPAVPDPNKNPYDLAKEYEKINSNRPNRMAYQQAVNEGSPKIERGNWAKLGAILAASAEGLSTKSATAGYNLGMSAYERPQMRADDEYEKKIRGLGNMANMEEADINRQMQQLEKKHGEFYLNKAEGRAERGENRADKLTDAQIHNMALDNIITIKEDDGNTYAYDKGTKAKWKIGKTDLTSKEQEDAAISTFARQEKIRGYYEHQANVTRGEYALEGTRLGVEGRNEVANTRAAASIKTAQDRLRANAATAPDKIAQGIMLDLAVAMDPSQGENALPPSAANYLEFDDNGTPRAYTPWFGDPAINEKVRKLIAYSIDKDQNPQNYPSAGSKNLGSMIGPTGGSPSGGTVTMRSPSGVTSQVPESQVQHYLSKGATIVNDGGGAPTGGNVPATSGANTGAPAGNFKPPAFKPYEEGAAPAPNKFAATANAPLPATAAAIPPPARNPFDPTGGNPFPPGPNVGLTGPMRKQPGIGLPSDQRGIINAPSINAMAPQGSHIPTKDLLVPSNPRASHAPAPPNYNNLPRQVASRLSPNVAPVTAPPPPPNPEEAAMRMAIPNPLMGLPGGNATLTPPAPPVELSPGAMGNIPTENPIRLNPNNLGAVPAQKTFTDKMSSIVKRVQAETGYTIRPNAKTRTPEEQAKFFAQGRTAPGKVVTPADGTKVKSQHQTGQAADLEVYDKNGKKVNSKKVWDSIGRIIKEEGLIWGGGFKNPEPWHVQLNPAR